MTLQVFNLIDKYILQNNLYKAVREFSRDVILNLSISSSASFGSHSPYYICAMAWTAPKGAGAVSPRRASNAGFLGHGRVNADQDDTVRESIIFVIHF